MLLMLAVLIAVGCGPRRAPNLGPTATVRRAPIERLVVATGTIEPENEVKVRSRIPGIVQKIYVKPGEHVDAGAPLLDIERDLLEAQVREARAALSAADVEKHFAKIALVRAKALSQRGVASARQLDDAQAKWERSEASVDRQRAALESLQVELGYTHITSPVAGKVLDVNVEQGDAVSAVTSVTGGTLLATLASGSTLHLKGLVDENQIAWVHLGQRARIHAEAYPGRVFAGRVSEIAPMGRREQNVTYFEVKITVVDKDAKQLKPRMSADADIVTEVVPNALVVPETALHYEGDRISVDVVDRRARTEPSHHDVRIGVVDGDRVQILSGLREGMQVMLQ